MDRHPRQHMLLIMDVGTTVGVFPATDVPDVTCTVPGQLLFPTRPPCPPCLLFLRSLRFSRRGGWLLAMGVPTGARDVKRGAKAPIEVGLEQAPLR